MSILRRMFNMINKEENTFLWKNWNDINLTKDS